MYLRMKGKAQESNDELTGHWSVVERRKWIAAMICGTMLLFATRSTVSICVVAMGHDLSWGKETSVSGLI